MSDYRTELAKQVPISLISLGGSDWNEQGKTVDADVIIVIWVCVRN